MLENWITKIKAKAIESIVWKVSKEWQSRLSEISQKLESKKQLSIKDKQIVSKIRKQIEAEAENIKIKYNAKKTAEEKQAYLDSITPENLALPAPSGKPVVKAQEVGKTWPTIIDVNPIIKGSAKTEVKSNFNSEKKTVKETKTDSNYQERVSNLERQSDENFLTAIERNKELIKEDPKKLDELLSKYKEKYNEQWNKMLSDEAKQEASKMTVSEQEWLPESLISAIRQVKPLLNLKKTSNFLSDIEQNINNPKVKKLVDEISEYIDTTWADKTIQEVWDYQLHDIALSNMKEPKSAKPSIKQKMVNSRNNIDTNTKINKISELTNNKTDMNEKTKAKVDSIQDVTPKWFWPWEWEWYTHILERRTWETTDQAITRSVWYQIDNWVVRIKETRDWFEATILQWDRPQVITSSSKQQLMNLVYWKLHPDYKVVGSEQIIPEEPKKLDIDMEKYKSMPKEEQVKEYQKDLKKELEKENIKSDESTSKESLQVKEEPKQSDYIPWDNITYKEAENAHRGTSFSSDVRAKSEIESHKKELQQTYDELSKYADTPEKKSLLLDEMKRFEDKYTQLKKDALWSRSNIVSSMIAWPARFPVARMQKRQWFYEKKVETMIDFKEKATKSIKKKLNNFWKEELNPINEVKQEIEQLKKQQESAKQHNIKVRKEWWEPIPWFSLTNLNNRIKAREEKLAKMENTEQAKSSWVESKEFQKFEWWSIIENVWADRLQIKFDSRPDFWTITELKKNWYRWSPTNWVWQRQLTNNAKYSLKFLNFLKPKE